MSRQSQLSIAATLRERIEQSKVQGVWKAPEYFEGDSVYRLATQPNIQRQTEFSFRVSGNGFTCVPSRNRESYQVRYIRPLTMAGAISNVV